MREPVIESMYYQMEPPSDSVFDELYDRAEDVADTLMDEIDALHGPQCPICGAGDEPHNIKLCRKCYDKLDVEILNKL